MPICKYGADADLRFEYCVYYYLVYTLLFIVTSGYQLAIDRYNNVLNLL